MVSIYEQARNIRKIWSGFQAARVLLTANNYRIFDHLKDYRTASALSRALKTDKRATAVLLDALTGLGFLRKRNGKYKNTAIANRFLVTDSPYYQGHIIKHADALWKNWSGLDRVLKTGRPNHDAMDFKSFILGMHDIAFLQKKEVIDSIPLEGVERALDLGGGPGTYSMEMAKRGVRVTLFDRPDAIRIARKLVRMNDIRGIDYMAGDFISDEIGSGYDLILISQVLHAYSEKDNIRIIRKCKRALNNKGRIAIQEFFIKNDRTTPLQSALFSVNMLVNTEGGRTYTADEIKGWCLKAGFSGVREKMVADNLLIIAMA